MSTMSLARAFTTRREKDSPLNLHVGRAASQRNGRAVKRAQISSPVALISSTNPLSHEAPDLPTKLSVAHVRNFTTTSNSSSTAEESDAPSLSFDGTDASSIDESPTTPGPEPNHLSCYFKPAVDTKTSNRSPVVSMHSSMDVPSIPQRVPSHSKKAHEFVHRKRSVQRLISPPASLVQRNSNDFFGSWSQPIEATPENPFGNELAQLDAVAEEMSHVVRDAEADDDNYHMQACGLAYFSADEYICAIGDVLYDFLADDPVWI